MGTIILITLLYVYILIKQLKTRWIWLCAIIASIPVYIHLVLWITVIRGDIIQEENVILVPLRVLCDILTRGWNGVGLYVAEAIIGNVILFLPLGLLISMALHHKSNTWVSLLLGIACSFSIEYYQLVHCVGTFEVDDIICNLLGALMGCNLGNMIRLYQQGVGKKQIRWAGMPIIVFGTVVGSCCIISWLATTLHLK